MRRAGLLLGAAALLAAPEGQAQGEPIDAAQPTAPASTGQPIAPVDTGQPIAPVSTGQPITPATSSQPIVPVGYERAPRLLVPAEVTGDSEGIAQARVGFGLMYGFGEPTDPTAWDLGIVAGLEVTSEGGFASLFGAGSDEGPTHEPAASFRLSVTLARLDLASPGGSSYPPLLIYLGGRVGRASFTYLGEGPDRRADTAAPTLAPMEAVEVPWRVGAQVISVFGGRKTLVPTLEGQAGFVSRWSAAPGSASFCAPVGEVLVGGEPAAGTSVFDVAEACTTAALGPPRASRELSLAAYVGALEKAAGASWRVALGLTAAIPVNDDAPEDLRLGLRAPLYVTLARAPAGTEYRGLVRLTPGVELRQLASGEREVVGLVELSLLGQRGLFPDQLDEPR